MPSADTYPVTVHLDGDIDLSAMETVVHELSVASRLSNEVVIDLRDVTYLDSNGVHVLAHALTRGATIVVDDAPAHVRRVVEMSGLLDPVV